MEKKTIGIRRILLPRDTNHRGEIFGGVILAEMDLAGAVEARKHAWDRDRRINYDVATVGVTDMSFRHRLAVGDVVTFFTELVKIGLTSITVRVEVRNGEDTLIADGIITYVALQQRRGPIQNPVLGMEKAIIGRSRHV